MTRTLTFITRLPPYGSGRPKACLDMVLAAAVFDQSIHYIFMDDGVWQLLPHQAPADIHAKSLGAAFPAMELYGIETIYVDADSMEKRQLKRSDLLPLNIRICSTEEIRHLVAASDQVFTF